MAGVLRYYRKRVSRALKEEEKTFKTLSAIMQSALTDDLRTVLLEEFDDADVKEAIYDSMDDIRKLSMNLIAGAGMELIGGGKPNQVATDKASELLGLTDEATEEWWEVKGESGAEDISWIVRNVIDNWWGSSIPKRYQGASRLETFKVLSERVPKALFQEYGELRDSLQEMFLVRLDVEEMSPAGGKLVSCAKSTAYTIRAYFWLTWAEEDYKKAVNLYRNLLEGIGNVLEEAKNSGATGEQRVRMFTSKILGLLR